MAKTSPWNITLFDDTLSLNSFVAPFNTHAADLNAALNSAANGLYLQYATKAAMVAVPGTRKGAHATVYADSTATNNGDYAWTGTQWSPVFASTAPSATITAASGWTVSTPEVAVSDCVVQLRVSAIKKSPAIPSSVSGNVANDLIGTLTNTTLRPVFTASLATDSTGYNSTFYIQSDGGIYLSAIAPGQGVDVGDAFIFSGTYIRALS